MGISDSNLGGLKGWELHFGSWYIPQVTILQTVTCTCAFPGLRLAVTAFGWASHLLPYPGWCEQGYLGPSCTNYSMLLVENNECRFPCVTGRKTGFMHNSLPVCVAISKQMFRAEDLSFSGSLMPGFSLALPWTGIRQVTIPRLPRRTLVLPAASHWAVGISCAREGHRLVNSTESKDRQDTNFPRRTPACVMSVPSTFSSDYGHHPFLLPEDTSSIGLSAQLKWTA